MFSSQILDVAIGLALMYLFQSILVSGINEVITVLISLRGRLLQKFLRSILLTKEGHDIIYESIMASPFIRQYTENKTFPSHIESGDFSHSVVDMLCREQEPGCIKSMDTLRAAIEKLPAGNFKDILRTKALLAENNLEHFRDSVSAWFDQYMTYVSGWYKKRVHIIIAILAFFITLSINVDSFKVMNELWKNDKLKESTIALAESVIQKGYEHDPAATTKDSISFALNHITEGYNELHILDFPITWEYEYRIKNNNASLTNLSVSQKLWWSVRQITLEKFIGFLVTTAAVILGAPIWFSLLQKLVDFRKK